MERRRSEPSAGAEEEEEEDRKTDLGQRQIHRRMMRRQSEPCGRMEDRRRSEWRKSGSIMEEEDKTEKGRKAGRRQSVSCMMVEDRPGGHVDRGQRDMDKKTVRRRSEPCGVLYVQLLPLSLRKKRELLQRRTGRRASCSEDGDRKRGDGHMSRGTSEPIGPLNNCKINVVVTIATTSFPQHISSSVL